MQMFAIFLSRLRSDRKGQDLIEYVLMGALLAVAAGAVMPDAANSISAIFSQVGSVATSAGGSSQDGTVVTNEVTEGDRAFTRQ